MRWPGVEDQRSVNGCSVPPVSSVSLDAFQIVTNHHRGSRAFTNCSSNLFGTASSDIACGVDAGNVGFELRACRDKSPLVKFGRVFQECCVRVESDKNEGCGRAQLFDFIGFEILDHDTVQLSYDRKWCTERMKEVAYPAG